MGRTEHPAAVSHPRVECCFTLHAFILLTCAILMTRTSKVPPAGKYISASAGESCSYLLRDNGIVDRTVRNGTVQKEMIPEHGTVYIQVGAGQSASYLLRNDGKVARTRTGGNIASVMAPPTRQEFLDQTKDCSIM